MYFLWRRYLGFSQNVKKLFLLVRATDAISATQRLHDEITGKELYRVLREKWGANFRSRISEKVIPVPGDIACENLRIEEADLRAEMWRQIDVIVNSAATTRFDERYNVAMGINVMGAMHVLNFAKKCTNIKMLLHVSTAFVSGEKAGPILERPFKMGETLDGTSLLNIDAEKKLVEKRLNDLRAEKGTEAEVTLAMKNFGIQRAVHYGWPNTYVLTKAMGEMLLGHFKENLPLVIIRPTIITSTYKEPFPGWIEGLRTMDTFVLGYDKGKLRCMLVDPDSISDLIPGDMVVNSIMVAMVVNANQPSQTIYHVGSSLRNPLRNVTVLECVFRYFTKNPWINRSKKLVEVGKLRAFSTMASFQNYMAIHYLLPLKVLKLLNIALCQQHEATYITLNGKIKFVMLLVELDKPYLLFKGIFDDINTENLRVAVIRENSGKEEEEEEAFCFDPKRIDWEDYFMNTHFPGVVKYLF